MKDTEIWRYSSQHRVSKVYGIYYQNPVEIFVIKVKSMIQKHIEIGDFLLNSVGVGPSCL